MIPEGLAVLVLAAGASRRMGRPKQLLPWGDELLIQYQLKQVKELQPDKGIWVVLGHEAEAISEVLPKGIHTLTAPQWFEGMGESLAYGVTEVVHLAKPSFILVVLSDQPGFTRSHYTQLIQAYTPSLHAVATSYEGRPGVPALFSDSCFPALTNVKGDRGASSLLRSWDTRVVVVRSEEDGFDIDTIEVYRERHRQIFGRDPHER